MSPRCSSSRQRHAQELLGESYQSIAFSQIKKEDNIEKHVNKWIEQSLKKQWKSHTRAISRSILNESQKHKFDPIFLIAVIAHESNFNPHAKGRFGEIGLMQIKPDTAKWIANKNHIPWKGAESLKNPATNIQIGSAYMAYLRTKFDHKSTLYLAAYNQGSSHLLRSLGKKLFPKRYPACVLQHYIRYYSKQT